MTTDGGPGYYTTVDVRPDHSFDHEADYLATPDQLSEPFTEKLAGSADEAFCHDLLDAVSRKTATDDRFEQALLQRPDVRIGSLSKAVRIGGEDDEMLDVLKQLAEMEDSPLPKGPFASKAVGEEEVGLGEFRGAITSIPELAGNDWAIVQTGDRRGGTKELMESVAARIGHGSRVYVEGVSGQAKVLVPIKLGFAG